MEDKLDDRKQRVLKAIIQDYVASAEPVFVTWDAAAGGQGC